MDAMNDILGDGQKIQPGVPPNKAMPTLTPVTPLQALSSEQLKIQKEEIPSISYAEMFKRMNPDRSPTADELEKEKKRQKREAVFSAIGDGISSLSNLFFTTRGAPSAYDPSNSLSSSLKTRYNKIKSDRDLAREKWMNGYFRASKMDEENKRYKHTLNREAIADGRYDVEQKKDDTRYNDNTTYRDKKATEEGERWLDNFKETVRHNKVTEAILGTRAATANNRSGIKKVAPKEETITVYDDKGSIKKIPIRLITKNDYWKYAKNALVSDGVIKGYASNNDFFRIMKDKSIYSNPKMKELLKVKEKLFGTSTKDNRKKTVDGFGNAQPVNKKKIEGF